MRASVTSVLLSLTLGLAASTAEAGPRLAGRVPAPFTTQAAQVAGRVTSWTEAGVRTSHVIRSQGAVIDNVIARAGLRDPLVMHQAALARVQIGLDGKVLSNANNGLATIAGKSYEFVVPASGRGWAQAIRDISPDIGGWLRARSLVPSNAQIFNGQWYVKVGSGWTPVRPPLIRLRSRLWAM